MSWITLAAGAALSWGVYGASLHRGQVELGNPLRAMLCVGVASFLIAILVPAAALTSQGEWRNFTLTGTATATLAGALGALPHLHHLRFSSRRLALDRHAAGVRGGATT